MPVALVPIRCLAVAGLLALALASSAAAQLLDVEPFTAIDAMQDIRFGNYTLAPGADSSVTVLTGTWSREISRQHAVAQRFSATGSPETELVVVDPDDDEYVAVPRIASDTRGGFVALWRRAERTSLLVRLLDAAGSPTTPEILVTSSAGQFFGTGFAAGFVVVWSQGNAVKARTYDASGQALGPAFDVTEFPPFSFFNLTVASTSNGGFIVVWDETARIRGRAYDAAAVPLGASFDVSDAFDLGGVATSPLGGVAVVGQRRLDTHARPAGIWARRFDDAGAASGPEFVVDFLDPALTAAPRAAFDPAGRLYVAWGMNSSIQTPRGRAYDAGGRPLLPPFVLAEDSAASLVLVPRPDGRFVEAWRTMSDLKMQVRTLCVPPFHTSCGDGVLQAPCERCDAGPGNSDGTPDACRTTCALPTCGDGVTDFFEQCDDGNLVGCDGCDAMCNLEPGYVCGDGALSTDCEEQCDDGAGNDDTLPNACRTDCQTAHCGDGVLDDAEGCDDGNRTSCDGCSDLCVPEPGLVCGDGIPELLCGEQCDDGNAIVGDGCTAPCLLERIPGGGSPATDCQAEWVVDNPANEPLYDKHGAISGAQACTDGDPRCDFDGVPGQCTFHLRVCANNTDLPSCDPGDRLQSWELRAPSAKKAATRPALAAVRDAFATVPGAVIGPDRPDVCSGTVAVPVAVKTSGAGSKAGKLILKSYATLYTGEKDSDRLKLICRP